MPARMSFLRTLFFRLKVEAVRILRIDVPLSANRQFQPLLLSSIRQHIEAVGKAIHQPGGRAQRDATNERQGPDRAIFVRGISIVAYS
jgi:hypothetical protein